MKYFNDKTRTFRHNIIKEDRDKRIFVKMANSTKSVSGQVVKVKAALQVAGSNPEIRRFSIKGGDGGMFQNLLTTLRSVYGLKTSDKCLLFWKGEVQWFKIYSFYQSIADGDVIYDMHVCR